MQTGQRKLIKKATDVHEQLIESGFKISYRSVALYIQNAKKKAKEAFIKQDYDLGFSVEFDWADVTLDIRELGGMYRVKIAVFTFKH